MEDEAVKISPFVGLLESHIEKHSSIEWFVLSSLFNHEDVELNLLSFEEGENVDQK